MGLSELKRMIREGLITRDGVMPFLRKFRNLMDPRTYQSAIDLHHRTRSAT